MKNITFFKYAKAARIMNPYSSLVKTGYLLIWFSGLLLMAIANTNMFTYAQVITDSGSEHLVEVSQPNVILLFLWIFAAWQYFHPTNGYKLLPVSVRRRTVYEVLLLFLKIFYVLAVFAVILLIYTIIAAFVSLGGVFSFASAFEEATQSIEKMGGYGITYTVLFYASIIFAGGIVSRMRNSRSRAIASAAVCAVTLLWTLLVVNAANNFNGFVWRGAVVEYLQYAANSWVYLIILGLICTATLASYIALVVVQERSKDY